ncbi:MAG: MerR family transcriptional regulator [Bacteroidetes bacterium]|nr:MerR family transcriptional regulator [Bacteroidota bacterium]
MKVMANYSIKDLENFTGIKAHTIRIWEKRYKIVTPKRTCTNIRYYDDDDLKKLLNVSILNRHGVKISNIANYSEESMTEKILNYSQSKNDIETQIEGLVLAMIDLDEQNFEKIFNNSVINLGFEQAILKLMYPFFEKIGILWQIGTINPAQEHFISNLLRQKLIAATDGIVNKTNSKSKTLVLFLPEGEHHELGLIFLNYIIRKFQHKVYYLGESVPIEGLIEISKAKKVDFFVTSIVTSLTNNEINKYLNTLAEQFPEQTIYLTGLRLKTIDFEFPANIILIGSIGEFKSELEKASLS